MANLDLTTYSPTVVNPEAPEYYNIATQTDGYKETTRNLESTSVTKLLVIFKAVHTSSGTPSKVNLLAHFNGEKGVNGTSFKLLNPPSYLGLSSSLDVRYTSWKAEPIEKDLWYVEFGLKEVP